MSNFFLESGGDDNFYSTHHYYMIDCLLCCHPTKILLEVITNKSIEKTVLCKISSYIFVDILYWMDWMDFCAGVSVCKGKCGYKKFRLWNKNCGLETIFVRCLFSQWMLCLFIFVLFLWNRANIIYSNHAI